MVPQFPSSAGPDPTAQADWLNLTDLGRLYGISAVLCGRLLAHAGLRHPDGAPTAMALHEELALLPHPHGHHRSALWNRRGCGRVLEAEGLRPMGQNRLVLLWADLLEALVHGSPAISTSAAEMAVELPRELVRPVNQELRERGTGFQVPLRRAQPRRSASACLRARSSSSFS
jgi:hypothetical protein